MNQPILTVSKNRENTWEYELREDFEIEAGRQQIIVPKGYSYDGATIPSVAWQALYTPFDPIIIIPSLIHDWLYSNHQVSRLEADDIFKDLLLKNGVPSDKTRIVHIAVRLLGEEYWQNTADELEYLRQLYSRIKTSPNLGLYKFPLDEMGIKD